MSKILICIYANNAHAYIYNFCAQLIKMNAFKNNCINYDICIAINTLDEGINSVLQLEHDIPSKFYKNKPGNIFISGIKNNYNIYDFFINAFIENEEFDIESYDYVWCINGASYFTSIDRDKNNILTDLNIAPALGDNDCYDISEYITDIVKNGYLNNMNYIIFQNLFGKYIFKPLSFKKILYDICDIFKQNKYDENNYKHAVENYEPYGELFTYTLPNVMNRMASLKTFKLFKTFDTNLISNCCGNKKDILNTLFKLTFVTYKLADLDETKNVYDDFSNLTNTRGIPQKYMGQLSLLVDSFLHGNVEIFNSNRANGAGVNYVKVNNVPVEIPEFMYDSKIWLYILFDFEENKIYPLWILVNDVYNTETFYE